MLACDEHISCQDCTLAIIQIYHGRIVTYAYPDTGSTFANFAGKFNQCSFANIAQIHIFT